MPPQVEKLDGLGREGQKGAVRQARKTKIGKRNKTNRPGRPELRIIVAAAVIAIAAAGYNAIGGFDIRTNPNSEIKNTRRRMVGRKLRCNSTVPIPRSCYNAFGQTLDFSAFASTSLPIVHLLPILPLRWFRVILSD